MPTLEGMNVDLDDVSFKPITDIALFNEGATITICTSLSLADITVCWNTKKRKLKVPTGKDTYIYIVNRRVEFYHIAPIKK